MINNPALLVLRNSVERVRDQERALGVPATKVTRLIRDVCDDGEALRGNLLALRCFERVHWRGIADRFERHTGPSVVAHFAQIFLRRRLFVYRPPRDEEYGHAFCSRRRVQGEGWRDRISAGAQLPAMYPAGSSRQ